MGYGLLYNTGFLTQWIYLPQWIYHRILGGKLLGTLQTARGQDTAKQRRVSALMIQQNSGKNTDRKKKKRPGL